MRHRKLYLIIFAVVLLAGVAAAGFWKSHRTRTAAVVAAVPKACSPCAHTIVLGYYDFGPQAMSWESIGMEWNQWKHQPHHDLPDEVEVKVVVYRDIDLSEVKKQFPVVEGKSDYRYFEYARAVQYLQENVKKVESLKKEEQEANQSEPRAVRMWDDLEQRLKKTQRDIIENLGV